MKKILIPCFLMLFAFACKTDRTSLSNDDYLVFGHYYGHCRGERCIEIYKLEKNRLSEDTKDQYPSQEKFYEGDFKELSKDKYNMAHELMSSFPPSLLKETRTVIGQPDYADGGGMYIEYKGNGTHKFWLLDQMRNDVPAEYLPFMDKVNEKIKLLETTPQ